MQVIRCCGTAQRLLHNRLYPVIACLNEDQSHLSLWTTHVDNTVMHISGTRNFCAVLSGTRHHLLLHDKTDIKISQRRYISKETYAKYLSPECPPIGYAQELLEQTHSLTGLPWWASIAVTTFTLRTVITLPLTVYTSHILARVEKLQPEIKKTAEQLRLEVSIAMKKFKWDQKMAKYQFNTNMKRLVKNLYVRENCHPFKATLVAWVQLPMWVSLSLALRNMAGALPFQGLDLPVLCADLATEGLLWFPNLLLPDTTWIMPITLGLLNLSIVEMHALSKTEPSRFQRYLTNGLRCISVFMVLVGASVPSCMCFYWTCSSLYGLGQNVLLKMPTVRRALGIPKMASESAQPFRDMYEIAKLKYGGKRKPQKAKKKDKK